MIRQRITVIQFVLPCSAGSVNSIVPVQAFLYRHLFPGFLVCVWFGAVWLSRRLGSAPVLQPAE